MSLPEKIPVLHESQMCRKVLDGRGGTHCLLGWIHAVKGDWYGRNQILDAVAAEIGWGNHTSYVGRSDAVAIFNDAPRNPKRLLAGIWNRAIKRLGYIRRGKWFIRPEKA